MGWFGRGKAGLVEEIPRARDVVQGPENEERRREAEWWREAQDLAQQIAPHINERLQAVKEGCFLNWYSHKFKKDYWKMLRIVAMRDGTVIVRVRGLPRLDDALGELYGARGYKVELSSNTCNDNSSDILISPM